MYSELKLRRADWKIQPVHVSDVTTLTFDLSARKYGYPLQVHGSIFSPNLKFIRHTRGPKRDGQAYKQTNGQTYRRTASFRNTPLRW